MEAEQTHPLETATHNEAPLTTPETATQEHETGTPAETQATETSEAQNEASLTAPETAAKPQETPAPAQEPEAGIPAPHNRAETANAPAETQPAPEQPQATEQAPAATAIDASPLKAWWESATFEGKEYATLQDDGTLMLNATPFSEARSIGNLTAENAAAITKALTDKFPDAAARVKDLADEWDSTEDKLKMTGKVSRTRDYLMNASAIGDFAPLYKQLAFWHNTVSEASGSNYKAKQDLVAKAESLADSEAWKETTTAMKGLTDEWKAIGFTDKDRSDELWNALEAARNKFYERKRAHQEGQEKELLQNLDIKMELVDKAENLAASESWRQTTDAFKALMDQWKETGRTVSDKNELLWQRFIAAKNVFFERKKQHYNTIQHEQEGNYAKKLDIVTRAEALSDSRDWNVTSLAYAGLMEEWKTSGRVPTDKADELWERMSKAKDVFYNNKRTHLDTQRVTLDDNMAQKRALIRRAQELERSTQWRETTDEFAELMEEWKKIGPVPREWNDKLWEEFTGSRRTFFENKDKARDRHKGQIVQQQQDRLSQARQFLKTLQDEIKDDLESFEDWKVSLTNITPGPKAKELKAHLEKLIAGAEPNMKRKQDKIESVMKQVEELEASAKKKPQREDRPKQQREDRPKTGEALQPAAMNEEQSAPETEAQEEAPAESSSLLSNEQEENAVVGDEGAPEANITQSDAGAGTPGGDEKPEQSAPANETEAHEPPAESSEGSSDKAAE